MYFTIIIHVGSDYNEKSNLKKCGQKLLTTINISDILVKVTELSAGSESP